MIQKLMMLKNRYEAYATAFFDDKTTFEVYEQSWIDYRLFQRLLAGRQATVLLADSQTATFGFLKLILHPLLATACFMRVKSSAQRLQREIR